MKAFGNLNDLLSNDKKAQRFYLSLPEYVQGAMIQHSERINSFESLQAYAQRMMHDKD